MSQGKGGVGGGGTRGGGGGERVGLLGLSGLNSTLRRGLFSKPQPHKF